jgi:cellulose synthase operon protein C
VETLVNDIEEARQAKNTRQHINALKRYLQARPEDSDRKVELLDLQAEHAPSSEVLFNVYHQYQVLLKKDPDNEKYRERVISLALRAGEYQDVLSQLAILSQHRDLTPEMLIWQATAQQKTGDEGAFQTYLKAIEADPGQFEAYVQLETITRQGREADEKTGFWIRQMTEANPNSAKAHLTQARYFLDTGDLPAALSAVETALRLNDLPTESVLLWSDIVMMSREQEMQTEGSTWQARDEQLTKRLQKAWEADPGEGEFAAKLSALALRRNRTDEAERILRKGLEQAPDDPLLRWELADLAITQGKLDEARELATQLTVSGLPRGLIEYLRGRIFLREQEWHEAAKCLRRARGDLASSPRLAAQADLYLADSYAELGEHDERVSVCRHAVQLQPFFVAARERLARALLAQGRIDEALGEYRTMLDLPDAPAIGWTKDVGWSAVAKVLILRNLSKPESERHWEDLDPILDSLSEAAPESLDALLFRAEVLTSRGQSAEARDLLEQHDETGAKDVRWWTALINLSLREGDLNRAQTLLHDAEQAVGDHVELKLLEATLAVHGSADGHVQLAEISRETADWRTPDRARLMYQLAALYVNVGRVDDAQAAYEEIAQLTPQDVRIWQLLFDEALNRNDLPAARKYLDVMRDIEGREGSHSLLAEAL